jgi:hypothetical protein
LLVNMVLATPLVRATPSDVVGPITVVKSRR